MEEHWKQEAMAFIQEMALQYFEKRDMGVVQEYLEGRTSWIGTGQGEVSTCLEQAVQALTREAEESQGALHVTKLECQSVELFGEGCVVYGTVTAQPENLALAQEDVRFTAVTEHTPQGIRLLHVHFSHADILQEQGHYYVPRAAIADNQALRSELALRARQLENLTKNIPGGVHQCVNDAHLTLLSMSDGFFDLLGYSMQEVDTLFHNQYINMIHPDDRAGVLSTVARQLEDGRDIELEYRVLHKNSSPIWILDKGRLIEDPKAGECFYCLLVEINDRKQGQEQLRLSLERHQVIMDQATDIIFEWDIHQDTLLFSQNWRKKFGYDPISDKISGQIPLSNNIHPEDMSAFIKIMQDTAAGVPYSETEFRIGDIHGNYLWCRIRATTQFDETKRPIKAVGVIVDIDQEKRQKQLLLDQAQKDALTGLYNKAAINALVEQQTRNHATRNLQALMIIDVDYFKLVNDTYGHLCGDSVLSDVATVLKAQIRSTDLAGRIGGDEFLIYLPEVSDQAALRKKVDTLLAALHTLSPEVGAPPVSCSIGAAIFPRGAIDYYALYKCADQALYYQKNHGRGGYTIYSAELDTAIPCGAAPTAIGTEIGSDQSNVIDEQMAQYAFRTLYSAKNIELALNRLLEIVGRSYGVSRAYIFESSPDKMHCSNTFEWCGPGIAPQREKLQNLSYQDDLDNYQQNFDQSSIFYCADVRETTPRVREVLEPQGICSMLQCAMLDEGEFVGYVGFDECKNYRAWSPGQVASFKLTADVLSTFLIKLRQRQRLKEQNK